jgi:hypothetical protein
MNTKAAVILLSGVLFACAPPPAPAPTPSPSPPPAPPPPAAVSTREVITGRHIVSIRAVNCQTLLSLSEDDRAAASMFYIGYTASRIRRATIDVAELSGLDAAALGYCTTYPSWPAATAFYKAFVNNGR